MSDVEIHHDRNVVFCKQICHRAVLIEFAELLTELQRAADQEAFYIAEPAGVLHLPDRAADCKHIQIARFQKPDKTVLFIFFHEIDGSVVLRSKDIDKAVEAAAYEPSLKRTVRIREAVQNARFRDLVRQVRVFLTSALRIVSFPSLIAADGTDFSGQHAEGIRNRFVPRFHTEIARTRAVNCRRIAECRQKVRKMRIVGIAEIPFRRRFSDLLEIHIVEILTHQFSAAAGNQAVILFTDVIFCQLFSALFRRRTDADAVLCIAVRAEIQLISHLFPFFLCICKRGLIWLCCASKRWCHEPDRSALFQIFRKSHVLSSFILTLLLPDSYTVSAHPRRSALRRSAQSTVPLLFPALLFRSSPR